MLTVQHIADIIQTILRLDDEHIVIYNQRHEIPADGSFYVVVGMMGMTPYASNRKMVGSSSDLKEETTQHMQEIISVEAFSRDTTAIDRAVEIIGALHSNYAQQSQETIGFKIGVVPTTMNDTSFLEGASLLYRVSMTFRVLRAYGMSRSVDYYDTFEEPEIHTEKGEV